MEQYWKGVCSGRDILTWKGRKGKQDNRKGESMGAGRARERWNNTGRMYGSWEGHSGRGWQGGDRKGDMVGEGVYGCWKGERRIWNNTGRVNVLGGAFWQGKGREVK